jgi:hypothetical protein
MKDEALRLALEALEDIGDEWGFTSQRTVPKRKEAIACLRLVIDAENISSKPMAWEQFYPEMGKPKLVEVQDGKCKHCTDGCSACDARKLPEQEPVQVSPLEFVEMVMEKEHLVGKPIFWAEWPNKEKNT